MSRIPDDAKHWDSGDWIEWHRSATGLDHRPCSAATQDPTARLTALHVNLLRAAKGYFQMTGQHLPVYDTIAHVHAAIQFDLPLEGPNRTCDSSGVEIVALPPYGPSNIIHVDLDKPFTSLVVVRIKDNFSVEARIMMRAALPEHTDGLYAVSWQSLSEQP